LTEEEAINKTTRDLLQFDLIHEDSREDVKFHLRLLWVVAWEQRGKELAMSNCKAIVILDKNKHILNSYPNVKQGVKKEKYSMTTVFNSLHNHNKPTSRGHYWYYKDEWDKLNSSLNEVLHQV
jgi:hypothetical protein